jgi:hypothetical protein
MGCPSENQGKTPFRYASSRRAGERSPPAASKPGAPSAAVNAWDTSGKGVFVSSQGIMLLTKLAHGNAPMLCVMASINRLENDKSFIFINLQKCTKKERFLLKKVQLISSMHIYREYFAWT